MSRGKIQNQQSNNTQKERTVIKTNDIVKSLSRFGIQSAAYKRPPTGVDVFALSIQPRSPEGIVTINQGAANVEIFGSRSRRQAVVSVRENGRKVTRKVKTTGSYNGGEVPNILTQREFLKSSFPVVMPINTSWTVKDVTCVKKFHKLSAIRHIAPDPHWEIKGVVTARVIRRTENNFLIGMDETHHFIAPLPKKVTSVKEAHRVLRPEVKRGSLRQGEWFFEPVTEKSLLKRLNTSADMTMYRRQGRFRLGNTTHYAMTHLSLIHRRKGDRKKAKHLYVRGDVIDGRQGHHAVLFLPTWHRVVRNKEGRLKVARAQRAMAAQRQRTWD